MSILAFAADDAQDPMIVARRLTVLQVTVLATAVVADAAGVSWMAGSPRLEAVAQGLVRLGILHTQDRCLSAFGHGVHRALLAISQEEE